MQQTRGRKLRREYQQQFVVINELPAPQRDQLKRHGDSPWRWTDTSEWLWNRRWNSGRAPAEIAISASGVGAIRMGMRNPPNGMPGSSAASK